MYNMKSKEFPMNPMTIADMRISPKIRSLGNIMSIMSFMLPDTNKTQIEYTLELKLIGPKEDGDD
jgi:hypothetical protein